LIWSIPPDFRRHNDLALAGDSGLHGLVRKHLTWVGSKISRWNCMGCR
jgi:hypothetical protein